MVLGPLPAMLRQLVIAVRGYLDDLLLQENSQAALTEHMEITIHSLQYFRWVLNLKQDPDQRVGVSWPES